MPSILSMPASATSAKAFGSLGLPNLIKRGRDGENRKLVRRVEDFKGSSARSDGLHPFGVMTSATGV